MAEVACPGCGHRAAAGARFCAECGTQLAAPACSACGATGQAGRFCQDCGAPLVGAPSTEAPGAEPAPRVVRKTTSVLFGDLVGFTPLSAARDIEDVRELLSRYFQRCRTVIARYGGTVEKFIGDAVMAVWGVPTVHEDDAERAVRAGLELTAAVADLAEEVGLPDLALRVGVVTGEVAVTEGLRGEGMVAGDAVNTAARVQAAARPGCLWVDAATRDRAAAAVAFADVGEHLLKGKPAPLRLYEAQAVTAAVGGARREDGLAAPLVGRARELAILTELFHSTVESQQPRLLVVTGSAGVGKTRLGRELEFYLDGLARPVWWHRGRCPAYGEVTPFAALAEAFRARLEIPLDANQADVDARLAAGLDRYVPDPDLRRWLGPRLAALLGGSDAVTDVPREDIFGAWTAFLAALSSTGAASGGGDLEPVLLLIEDAQHADEGLLDFCEQATDQGRLPLLILVLARPELLDRRPGLGSGPRRGSLHLDPLPDRSMVVLADHLVAELSDAARRRLVQRAEGIPLFAVETVRWLVDRGVVVPREGRYVAAPDAEAVLADPAAPATIEAVVAARLDGLPPGPRELLGDAAVLGPEFDLDGLAALGHDRRVAATLVGHLVRGGLLRPARQPSPGAGGGLAFAQTVTRTVAYGTLSRKDRRARHLAVAEHLASLEDPARERVAAVAQHLFAAVAAAPGNDDPALRERAVTMLALAARRALDLGAPAEALLLAEQGLDAIGVEDGDRAADLHDLVAEAEAQRGDLAAAGAHAREAVSGHRAAGRVLAAARSAAALGRALNQHGRNAEALAVVAPWWRELDALRRQDKPTDELEATYLMVLVRVAGALVWPIPRDGYEDLPAAEVAMLEAVSLAERRNDAVELAHALNVVSIHFHLQDAPETSLALLERGVDVARAAVRPAEEVFTLMNLCATLLPRQLRRAAEVAERALVLIDRVPIPVRLDMAAGMRAVTAWLEGEWATAREMVGRLQGAFSWSEAAGRAVGELIAAATGIPSTADPPPAGEDDNAGRVMLATLARELPRSRPDVARLAASVQAAVAAEGLNEDTWLAWPAIVDVALDENELTVAAELIALVSPAPAHSLTPLGSAQLRRLQGELALARGDASPAAADDLAAAVEQLDRFGARFYAARARAALGRALLGADRPAAQAHLERAAEAFVELGAGLWADRARRLLAEWGAVVA